MSSVLTPRACSTRVLLVAEVVADRADHADVREEARREREVDGGAAEHARRARRTASSRSRMRSSRLRRGSWRRHDSLPTLVRAVQIKEFGGPDVLEVVEDAPVPEPGERRGPDQGLARGDQLRRHARARELLPREVRAAADAGGRGRGHATRTANRVVALLEHRRLRRVRRRPEGDARSRSRTGSTTARRSRSLIQGLTAWHLYRTSAKLRRGRVGRRARGRGRRRQPGRSARRSRSAPGG